MSCYLSFLSATILGAASASNQKARRALESLRSPPEYRVQGPYLVSAVIPTYNEEEYLPNCLRSLRNQTYTPIEIIVADHASVDRTRAIAHEHGARLFDVSKRGIGLARDIGVRGSTGEVLFHTDADCIFEHRLVEECVRTLEDGADIVHVPYVFYDESDSFYQAGCALRSFKADWQTSGQCIIGWRGVFEALDGFLGLPCGEDHTFGVRAKKAGYKIVFRRDLALATSFRRWRGESRAPCHPQITWDGNEITLYTE